MKRSLNVLSHIEFPDSEVWKAESGRQKAEIPLNIPLHIEFSIFNFQSLEGRKHKAKVGKVSLVLKWPF